MLQKLVLLCFPERELVGRNVFVKLSNAVSAEAPSYSRQIMKMGS
jgi:hypothetical protein